MTSMADQIENGERRIKELEAQIERLREENRLLRKLPHRAYREGWGVWEPTDRPDLEEEWWPNSDVKKELGSLTHARGS